MHDFKYKTLGLMRIFCFNQCHNKEFLSFFRGKVISSRLCITVSKSRNPSRVYIRLCKHGKRFLLLNYRIRSGVHDGLRKEQEGYR